MDVGRAGRTDGGRKGHERKDQVGSWGAKRCKDGKRRDGWMEGGGRGGTRDESYHEVGDS